MADVGRGRAGQPPHAGRPAHLPADPSRGHRGGDGGCLSCASTARAHELDAPVGTSLAEALRERFGLTGTKIACNEGHCGACTVLVDGTPTLSCITLAHRVGGREVTTIEGLRDHAMVDAFVRADAVQCGFCTPGQIVSAVALVRDAPSRASDEIRHRMSGNLCRCGTYPEDRGGDSHVARLIRTEKEVEGRREEVWLVVEEDALEQWPAGPLEVVGRPAPRVDGPERVRGEATFTADVQLPGTLHTAVLRSPHAHARVRGSTSRRRSRRRACAPRSGRATSRRSARSAATRASRSPPSARRRASRPRRRSR